MAATFTSSRCRPWWSVKEGLNLPRYPSVPGRLRAKRKPLGGVDAGALGPPRLEMVRLELPP